MNECFDLGSLTRFYTISITLIRSCILLYDPRTPLYGLKRSHAEHLQLLYRLIGPFLICPQSPSYTIVTEIWPCGMEFLIYVRHGTIIRTEITYKKMSCYMRDSACLWFIVKKAKVFWSYVKYFWILMGVKKSRILIGLCKSAFLNCPTIFVDWHNKTKLVPASFSCF